MCVSAPTTVFLFGVSGFGAAALVRFGFTTGLGGAVELARFAAAADLPAAIRSTNELRSLASRIPFTRLRP